MSVIDLHCHLLPGLDDGPPTLEEAIEQARAHVAGGVKTVVCTPHVSQGYRNDSATIADAVEAFRDTLDEEAIDLQVLAGAEVSLSRAMELPDAELSALHLGESGWLLLEPPLSSDVPRLRETIQGLQSLGHHILVAHPERCAAFHHDGDLLARLVDAGAAAQITATSLTGQFGRTVQKLARTMLDAGLVHVVASDAHDAVRRPPGLRTVLESARLGDVADWACDRNPSAVLADRPLPVLGGSPRRTLSGRFRIRRPVRN